jgi:hypothetical protein
VELSLDSLLKTTERVTTSETPYYHHAKGKDKDE